MNPNETQPNNPQDNIALTNDELAAAMGYMTTLGEQNMMAQMQPNQDISQETPPETPENALGKDLELEDIKAEKEGLKNEILDEVKKEVKSVIKEELKNLLDEDE